jgi:hypothetical protein
LPPGELTTINLADPQKTVQVPADATWGTVKLSYTGRTADLIAIALSYDQNRRYGLQTPFSENVSRMWAGGMWHVDPTHNTFITTGNAGAESTAAQITLVYNGGKSKYRLEKILSPSQQLWVDVGELIRDQVADSDGHTLPTDTMNGSYELRDLDHATVGHLYEGKLVIDKTYGHASYGCGSCCGYNRPVLGPSPFGAPPGIDNQDFIHANSTCDGQVEDVTGSGYSWGSTNTTVATLPNSTLHTVAVGYATGNADVELEWAHPPTCPNTIFAAQQQSVTVAPCPSSVTVDQTTPKSLPDYDQPTWLTGVGILARMKAGPTGTDYTGAVLLETVTPTTNSCPSNIQQYTSFPTVTLATSKPFTVGSSAVWEGNNFPSILNDFYDSHRLLVNINVLGLTSVQSCVAQATQTYSCNGSTVGTFTLTNTYVKGTLNGQAVTNVSTTKQ